MMMKIASIFEQQSMSHGNFTWKTGQIFHFRHTCNTCENIIIGRHENKKRDPCNRINCKHQRRISLLKSKPSTALLPCYLSAHSSVNQHLDAYITSSPNKCKLSFVGAAVWLIDLWRHLCCDSVSISIVYRETMFRSNINLSPYIPLHILTFHFISFHYNTIKSNNAEQSRQRYAVEKKSNWMSCNTPFKVNWTRDRCGI